MGYVLFESSGTFNPATYGLVTGDPIQVVVVGGGGGGTTSSQSISYGESYTTNNIAATAGTASSFGSYVTASGGNAGGTSFKTSNTPFMSKLISRAAGSAVTQYYYGIAIQSMGEDGWLPTGVQPFDLTGVCTLLLSDPMAVLPTLFPVSGRILYSFTASTSGTTTYVSSNTNYVGASETAARTDKRGGYSYDNYLYTTGLIGTSMSKYVYLTAGIPGLGYGAGGAGGAYSSYRSGSSTSYYRGTGGRAGTVAYGSLVLPNTNSITVTVGVGGIGGTSTHTVGYYHYGGGGASGCVAVFW